MHCITMVTLTTIIISQLGWVYPAFLKVKEKHNYGQADYAKKVARYSALSPL